MARKKSKGRLRVLQLPAGTTLYLAFIKVTIMYLIIRFIISDAYNLFTSITSGKYCTTNPTQCADGSSILSGYNKHDD